MELKTEPLSTSHGTEGFDCGEQALNDYLRRYALPNQSAGAARVYVVLLAGQVIAYYSLSAGSAEPGAAGGRLAKGQPRHQPIPIILLGRLAVDLRQQGRSLGKLLLRDAILRFLAAAEIIGARALLIHAKNQRLVGYYAPYGFEPLATNPLHLALFLKDARRSAG